MEGGKIDIMEYDATIRQAIGAQVASLPSLRARLSSLEATKIDLIPLAFRSGLAQSITALELKIADIESGVELGAYATQTLKPMTEYKDLMSQPVSISFMGGVNPTTIRKKEIVAEYLYLAKPWILRYVKIARPKAVKLTTAERKKRKTQERKTRLREMQLKIDRIERACECGCKNFDFQDSSRICTACGMVKEIAEVNSSFKDGDRINVSSKYTYNRTVNFRNSINQYQGKQLCTIPEHVYTNLEAEFIKNGLVPALAPGEVSSTARFAKVTRKAVSDTLRHLRYPKHYENVNLIHSHLTGFRPPDISHLTDALMEDFGKFLEVYDRKYKESLFRTNFISVQFILYQLLCRHGHVVVNQDGTKRPPQLEDFVILKTIERKILHDTVTKDIFRELGFNYVSLF